MKEASESMAGYGALDQSGERSTRILTTGELIDGTYEILSLLGSGGMGQVFEALDHQLNRRVAIKAAWPNPLSPPLRNEARALAAFRHPSLVTVHTLGEHRGVDFLVMERIYGVPLNEHLAAREDSQLSLKDALQILVPVAEGLSVVHRAGLVHRDIKPENIMLAPDRRVVLMDFGLVLPEFDVQAQGTVAGSPPYMSPEALAGSTEPGHGHLVDIFALGVLAYELLTGERPFDGMTLREVWSAHEAGTVVPLEAYRLDCRKDLVALVQDMIASDPSERVQSAEAVAWGLRAIRDSPVSGKEQETVERRRSVLIVDDDRDLARILGFYVEQIMGDVDLRVAHDGEEALREVCEREPDLMLLDLHMPRMNGIELCMHLRGDGLASNCRIVSVSAGAQENDVQLLHQLGIHHFVQKGSNLRERLRGTLEEACRETTLLGRLEQWETSL